MEWQLRNCLQAGWRAAAANARVQQGCVAVVCSFGITACAHEIRVSNLQYLGDMNARRYGAMNSTRQAHCATALQRAVMRNVRLIVSRCYTGRLRCAHHSIDAVPQVAMTQRHAPELFATHNVRITVGRSEGVAPGWEGQAYCPKDSLCCTIWLGVLLCRRSRHSVYAGHYDNVRQSACSLREASIDQAPAERGQQAPTLEEYSDATACVKSARCAVIVYPPVHEAERNDVLKRRVRSRALASLRAAGSCEIETWPLATPAHTAHQKGGRNVFDMMCTRMPRSASALYTTPLACAGTARLSASAKATRSGMLRMRASGSLSSQHLRVAD